MKWLTRLTMVLILLGGLATAGLFGVLIFAPPQSARLSAVLLQGGTAAALVLWLGLVLGAVRALILLFKK